jgi:hypothetical protein
LTILEDTVANTPTPTASIVKILTTEVLNNDLNNPTTITALSQVLEPGLYTAKIIGRGRGQGATTGYALYLHPQIGSEANIPFIDGSLLNRSSTQGTPSYVTQEGAPSFRAFQMPSGITSGDGAFVYQGLLSVTATTLIEVLLRTEALTTTSYIERAILVYEKIA